MSRRPKPPLAEWLAAKRKERGESVEDVARIVDRQPGTIRVWEAGRPPSPLDGSIVVLERHWDSSAPKEETPPGDQGALIAAMEAQTRAINELVVLLRPLAEAQALQVADLQRAVQRLYALVTPEAQATPAPREIEE